MKFVFEVRIKPGHTEEQYAEGWARASEIIQREPGAQGTKLHRKIGEPGVLLAIATWESKAARDTAMKKINAERDPRIRKILDEDGGHAEFTVMGHFDEPTWTVDPPQKT